jgi:thiol-disulfide isomerase/thioredoxin
MRILLTAVLGLTILGSTLTSARAEQASSSPVAAPAPSANAVPAVPPVAEVPKPQPEDLVGQPAPDFNLTDVDGNEHKLSDYTGKTVLIDWFNPGCPAVKAYYEKAEFVAQMNAALTGKDDIVWLSINSGADGQEGSGVEANKTYAETVGKVNPILLDESGEVGHSYKAQRTPTVYVVSPEGVVVYAGAFDQATSPREAPKGETLALAAVEAARKGDAPVVSSAKAFG